MPDAYVPFSSTPLNYEKGLLAWWSTDAGVVATVDNIGQIYSNWGIWHLVSASYTADQYGIIQSADVTAGLNQALITYKFVQTSTFDAQNRIVSNTLVDFVDNHVGDSGTNTEASTFQYSTDQAGNLTTTIHVAENYTDHFPDSTGDTSGSASATEDGPNSDIPLPNGGVNVPNVTPNPHGASIAISKTGSGTATETFSIAANPSLAGTYTYNPSTATWTAPTS